MNELKKISEGRTAEIFAQDQGKIVKLYRDGLPEEVVKYEFEVNRVIARLGIPAPKAYELIDYSQRKGIVFDRIEGSTLLRMSIQYPNELTKLMQQFAYIHFQIHEHNLTEKQLEGTSMGSQKAALAYNIQSTALLSEDVKQQIISYLQVLPDGNCLCHGDFHPDNVLIGERNWVIDWMTGMVGNPAGDVARTFLLFRYGSLPDEAPGHVKEALGRIRTQINDVYLEQYLSYSKLSFSDIDHWVLPIAAARLTESIPDEEKELLVNVIEERLIKTTLPIDE